MMYLKRKYIAVLGYHNTIFNDKTFFGVFCHIACSNAAETCNNRSWCIVEQKK